MPQKNIVVMGASAGGIRALQEVLRGLPADFEAAVFVVLHISPDVPSRLPEIFQRSCALPVAHASDGEPVRGGRVYVAPPDHHIMLEFDRVRVTHGPKENRARPAIDVLFRSAAQVYRNRVVGVVLTGALDDGTAGMWAVQFRGGATVVQDPAEAEFPSMPQSVLRYLKVDLVLPLRAIAPRLVELTREFAPATGAPVSKTLETETRIAAQDRAFELSVMSLGPVSPFTCPECHGVLIELKEGGIPRFRCHTGHAYSLGTLLAEVQETVEGELWNAVRAIEEHVMLLDHIAQHARDRGVDPPEVERITLRSKTAQESVEALRRVLHQQERPSRNIPIPQAEIPRDD